MGDGLLGYSRSTWRLMCRGKLVAGQWHGQTSCGCACQQLPPLPCAHPCTYSRDELKLTINLGVLDRGEMEDLASFDEELADYLYKQPAEHLQLVSGTLPWDPCPGTPGLASLWSLTACPPPSPAGGSCQGGG